MTSQTKVAPQVANDDFATMFDPSALSINQGVANCALKSTYTNRVCGGMINPKSP